MSTESVVVCGGCGGPVTPIQTVNNSGEPAVWTGCEHCDRFTNGVEPIYFRVARKLVEDGELTAYSHMVRVDYEKTPETLAYYLDTQTDGLSRIIKRVEKLLEQMK